MSYDAKASSRSSVAVFFGGRSPEHDVSVVSGLQVLSATDTQRYDAFPVYIAPDGAWLTGEALRRRENYMLTPQTLKTLTAVTLDVQPGQRARLLPKKSGLFGGAKPVEFDIAVPVFHGLYGEDGNMQGVFEMAGVPYTGMRTLASSILMDKAVTKLALRSLGIPMLPSAVINRPAQGYMIDAAALTDMLKGIDFPCIVKPVHLGSSIGVAKVNNVEELRACLPPIFAFDDQALVEPFVENLVEYNVAVCRIDGAVRTSAIERPKTHDELLDFKQKYLSGGDGKSGKAGTKTAGPVSQGMLSLTRELNPPLTAEAEKNIRDWAARMFEGLNGTGAPRIDFIGNSKTGEIWLNEVNPIPGSFGYFLWEAAAQPVLFTELLTHLIEEAQREKRKRHLPADPVPREARLHRRAGP